MTTDKSRDESFREMGEAIRRMLEASGNGQRPVIINIRVQVNIAPPEESPGEEAVEIEVPDIEIQKVGDEVKVVAGLPGVSSDDIRVMLGPGHICIQARDGRRVYRSATEIPAPDRNTVRIAFRHGVLEISYRELGADPDEKEEKEG